MKGAAICMLVLAVAYLMVEPGDAVACGDVTKAVAPCVPFLTGSEQKPASGCCDGVKQLKNLAPTPEDRRAACACIKTASAKYKDLKPDAVSSLPTHCGVSLPFPVSKDIDCSTIP
ncbi:non-specific lipid-transfer protein A-like [Magnolia sinica]|uniref:non-specific lipid-transfer protein A-like n=1 Tax=Magnolia sinica TaxID=86752 RepID=UPI002659BEFE|nr:non-specific lipid-transfer protein A-like [Magnolia sinica]